MEEAYLLNLLSDDVFLDFPFDNPLQWVHLHAWRALGMMHSLNALEKLLNIASGDNNLAQYAYNDFSRFCSFLGAKAIQYLANILKDQSNLEISRTLAAEGLGAIGSSVTGANRLQIVEILMQHIRETGDEYGWVNGSAAESLMVMQEKSIDREILDLIDRGHIQVGIIRLKKLRDYFDQNES